MMLNITERCTMGCPHCMSDAKPDGKDMDFKVLQDVLNFLLTNGLGKHNLLITGGEPTEHADFDLFMKEIIRFGKENRCFTVITVTTNGEQIQKDRGSQERFKSYIKQAEKAGFHLIFQVSADPRYYPRRIETHKRIFREKGFVMCDNCIERIYPQGRALQNKLPWTALASKCFNARAIAHQLSSGAKLKNIEDALTSRGKFCTPHISINGDIKLGESMLCPVCASIYDDMDTIMQVGKDGVNENMIKTVSDALEARELIKMRALENSGMTSREAAEELAAAVGADVVSVVGTRFVLYRRSEKNPKIELA